MSVKLSYNKLWKMLIDKNMNKGDLRELVGFSSCSLTKLSKGECVNTSLLLKICDKLDCDLNDIVETVRN